MPSPGRKHPRSLSDEGAAGMTYRPFRLKRWVSGTLGRPAEDADGKAPSFRILVPLERRRPPSPSPGTARAIPLYRPLSARACLFPA